MLIQQTDLHYR